MTFLKSSISVFAVMSFMASAANAADLEPVAAPIAAETISKNFYISIFAGGNLSVGDDAFSNGTTNVAIERDTGFNVGGAVGYKWKDLSRGGITPRTEIEFSYFDNNVDQLDFSGNGLSPDIIIGDADVSGFNVLGNLYLDFNNIGNTGFTPYVVGGLGVSVVNLDLAYNPAALNPLNLDDTSTNFLWSVGAGASYELTDNVSIFGDARFQQAIGVDSVRRGGGTPGPVPAGPGGGVFEDDLSNVVIRGGLSYSF